MKTNNTYTMKEINAEIKKLGFSISKRSATLNGSATYKVEGGDFNPAAIYTKSDLIEKLFF